MSSIYFDDGALGTTRPHDASSDKLLAWLKHLAGLGRIAATAAQPASPAFVVAAAEAGTYGNKIEVTTGPAAAPTKPDSVDVTVSATDRYPDVKVGELEGLLGSAAGAGT